MTHEEGQGREGMASVNASRAALGMKPLSDTDPYEAEEWLEAIVWTAVAFAFVGFCAVALFGAPLVYPFT